MLFRSDYSGQLINYEVIYQEEDFGFNQKKVLAERIVVNSRGMRGASVFVESDGVRKIVGSIDDRVSDVSVDSQKANVFQMGISGTVAGARGTLKEVEMPNIQVLASY